MHSFPYRTPALPIRQPFGTFYVTTLPASLLLEVGFSDLARVEEAGTTGYRVVGTQRKQHISRWREIGEFIDTTEAVFPTSIVLAVNYREDGSLEEGESRWRVEGELGSCLLIPTAERLASVVDGQHRLWAFNYARDEDRTGMPLVCSVFFDLPNPYQAYLFATVNFNQKKVQRSLVYELFGFDTESDPPEAWTPEKTAVFLTRRLNMDSESPLRGRIVVAPRDDEGLTRSDLSGSWSVSTATVVDGLLRLFSRRPKRDRTAMFKVGRGRRSRRDLGDDGTPARGMYQETNDKAIYILAKNFLAAVDAVFWRSADARSSLIRTVGIQAFFDIMFMVAGPAIEARKLGVGYFVEIVRPASGIAFEDSFFETSGKGRTRIKNTLAVAMGLTAFEALPDSDREQYVEIVGRGRERK